MRKTNSGLWRRGPWRDRPQQAGFTLPELLIAIAIFTVVGGATFGLMQTHMPLFNQQQNQAGLNVAMRNAIAQMQTDVVNGGGGYYSTTGSVPNWPVGIVIKNNVVTSSGNCATGLVYGSTCFDSFITITPDPNTLPANPAGTSTSGLTTTAGTCPSQNTNTNVGTSLYVLPPSGVTAATYATSFHTGDLVLLVTSNGGSYTIVSLTGNGSSGNYGSPTTAMTVLPFNTTGATIGGTSYPGANSSAHDTTGATVNSGDATNNLYCAQDSVIRLAPVEYDVDITTSSTNPTLRRTVLTQGATPSANGVPLANQVIGFKVGATVVSGSTDTTTYNFDSSTYSYDPTVVRSVMISLIGRTTPNPDPTYVYRNAFDGGAYQVLGVSAVVNPRNLSM